MTIHQYLKSVYFIILAGMMILTACDDVKPQNDSSNDQNTEGVNSDAKIKIVEDDSGFKLVVNGKDFIVNGMNWKYYPIGTNYDYYLWDETDEFIKAALDREMTMLKDMRINALRHYTDIPPRWIQYIYENYGIYTMLTHSFGRYGLTLEGEWVNPTDYGESRVQKLLMSEVTEMAQTYKGTPGLLLYLLGNENNFGLFWQGAETEDIPEDVDPATYRARDMYKLFNRAILAIKGIDNELPVAICNGEVMFIDIIKEECKAVDILGINVYRGVSFGDLFQSVKEKLNIPLLLTEFGGDAYNALEEREDQQAQAYYLLGNWKEIYENAAGLGLANNSLGGFTFAFSDGWWKSGQTVELDIHNTYASWENGGYSFDFKPGVNNMNEEWFGICAKGPRDDSGLYPLYPRAAYYLLQEVHKIDPYREGVTLQSLQETFEDIKLEDAMEKATRTKAPENKTKKKEK